MISLLMTKQGAIGAAIVLALITGAAWLNGEIRAAKEQGQAEELARVAELNWQAIMDSVNGSWAEREATANERIQALSSELESQSSVATAASERALEAISDARGRLALLSDSINTLTAEDVAAISAGIDSLEIAERLCQGALGTCQELVKVSDSRIFDLEAQHRQTLDVSRQQAIVIDRLQNLRRPKIGSVGYLGWLTAAAAIVVAVVR